MIEEFGAYETYDDYDKEYKMDESYGILKYDTKFWKTK
jgi:hypothetical protein